MSFAWTNINNLGGGLFHLCHTNWALGWILQADRLSWKVLFIFYLSLFNYFVFLFYFDFVTLNGCIYFLRLSQRAVHFSLYLFKVILRRTQNYLRLYFSSDSRLSIYRLSWRDFSSWRVSYKLSCWWNFNFLLQRLFFKLDRCMYFLKSFRFFECLCIFFWWRYIIFKNWVLMVNFLFL